MRRLGVRPARRRTPQERDEYFMRLALRQAQKAAQIAEVPVGAVVVKDGRVLGVGCNLRETEKSSLCHAEIVAIHRACKRINDWRLSGCEIFVTREPCPMCAGAILHARVDRVIWGAADTVQGSYGSVINMSHLQLPGGPKVTSGVLEEECNAVMANFFKKIRQKKAQKN